MSARFTIWWRARTMREQRLLLVMAGLALLTFSWLLVIRPMEDALSEARERHGNAVIALAEARAQAQLVAGLEKNRPSDPGASLDSLLMTSAAEAGFQVARIEREGPGQATLVIDAVRPQAFFGWVATMEAERGLIVEQLGATANSDQTLSVQITFRGRKG
jgi:general secretion pathway protein M